MTKKLITRQEAEEQILALYPFCNPDQLVFRTEVGLEYMRTEFAGFSIPKSKVTRTFLDYPEKNISIPLDRQAESPFA